MILFIQKVFDLLLPKGILFGQFMSSRLHALQDVVDKTFVYTFRSLSKTNRQLLLLMLRVLFDDSRNHSENVVLCFVPYKQVINMRINEGHEYQLKRDLSMLALLTETNRYSKITPQKINITYGHLSGYSSDFLFQINVLW